LPAAHGLFHKAGIQSGSGLRGGSKEAATETALRVLAGLGLTAKDVGKLADVPAEKLLALQLAGNKGPLAAPTKDWLAKHPKPPTPFDNDSQPGNWGPVVDGTVLPRHPFDPDATPLAANVPLLLGNTKEEAIFWLRDTPDFFRSDMAALTALAHLQLGAAADPILALYRRTRPQASPQELGIAIMTAMSFGNETTTLADRKSHQPAPVYRYRYDYPSNVPIKGTDWTYRTGHASDISLVFLDHDMLDLEGNGPGLTDAAKAISGYFTSFARSAVPSAANQPAWPRYDTSNRAVMLFNSQCRVENDPDSEERKFWQSFGKG